MSDEALERPGSADDLYLISSGDAMSESRPLLTGDIFSKIEIPGLDDGHGMAVVVTHPCNMRLDGIRLAKRIQMARVRPSAKIPLADWPTKHFKVMPFPKLVGEHHSAYFQETGLVPSDSLSVDNRVACLTPFGVNLLQQRFIWYMTRFIAPTDKLQEATGAVFQEAELCEEWVDHLGQIGVGIEDASASFHDWIRSVDESGHTRQSLLALPQRRAGVRRDMRSKLASIDTEV